MNAIEAPPEFYRLARAFRFEGPKKDEHEWIASVLHYLDPQSQRALKRFLTDLLDQNPDEAELQKLWNSTDSNYYIVGKHGNDGVRQVLTMIRDQIE